MSEDIENCILCKEQFYISAGMFFGQANNHSFICDDCRTKLISLDDMLIVLSKLENVLFELAYPKYPKDEEILRVELKEALRKNGMIK
jgi:hypothetical protein